MKVYTIPMNGYEYAAEVLANNALTADPPYVQIAQGFPINPGYNYVNTTSLLMATALSKNMIFYLFYFTTTALLAVDTSGTAPYSDYMWSSYNSLQPLNSSSNYRLFFRPLIVPKVNISIPINKTCNMTGNYTLQVTLDTINVSQNITCIAATTTTTTTTSTTTTTTTTIPPIVPTGMFASLKYMFTTLMPKFTVFTPILINSIIN
jgi:hypothetical protein